MALEMVTTLKKTQLDDNIIECHQVEYVDYACAKADRPAAWQNYPFNLTSYNPLTEWGAHYARIFEMDFFPKVSKFDMLDMTGNDTCEYQSVKTIDYNIVLITIRFQGNVASVEPRR
jgi:hypothetical protein